MKLNKFSPIICSVVVIFLLLVVSYFLPNSLFSKIINHLNTTSSILIMVLTLFYVITTNHQLQAMEMQIKLTKENTNLQVQPIPVPIIENMKLEKIQPFIAPEDSFMKMYILSRFFCDIKFKNVGNGTALNVVIFPTIITNKQKIPAPSLRPELTYCISNEVLDENKIHIMMFDTGTDIAKGILNYDAKLELNIYYKNIFNVGFHEVICYSLFLEDKNDDWKQFVNNEQTVLIKKLQKHNAVKPIDKDDAKKIFKEVEDELEKRFNSDLDIRYLVESKSYTIEIVDYNTAVKEMEIQNEKNFKEIFKDRYEKIKSIREKDMWHDYGT